LHLLTGFRRPEHMRKIGEAAWCEERDAPGYGEPITWNKDTCNNCCQTLVDWEEITWFKENYQYLCKNGKYQIKEISLVWTKLISSFSNNISEYQD
jgi:hypothetical protein